MLRFASSPMLWLLLLSMLSPSCMLAAEPMLQASPGEPGSWAIPISTTYPDGRVVWHQQGIQQTQVQQIPDWANAIGRVRMVRSGYGGSCTLITIQGGYGYCVTNRHVVGGTNDCVVTFPGGAKFQGRVCWRVPGADAALIQIAEPQGIKPLPLADVDEQPQLGEEVYLAGWGGGGQPRLTIWRARWRGYTAGRQTDVAAATNLISGDSGGAQVFGGRLVGVNWGGPLAGASGPMRQAEGVSSAYILHQMRRHHGLTQARWCPPGGCQPGSGQRPFPGTIDLIPLTPLNRPQEPQEQPIAQNPGCDCPKTIVAPGGSQVPQNGQGGCLCPPPVPGPAGEQGPPGVAGPPGKPGKDGRDGTDAVFDAEAAAAAIIDKLPPVVLELSDGDPSTPDTYVSGRLGEPLVIPPQVLRIREGNESYTISERLGEAIKIKVEGLLDASQTQ